MKFNNDNKYLNWGITAFLTAAAIILFGFLLFNLKGVVDLIGKFFKIISPIINGFVIAYLLIPLVNRVEKFILDEKRQKKLFRDKKTGKELDEKGKKRVYKNIRVISICTVYICVIIILYLFFSLVIPEIIDSIENIAKQFPQYRDNLLSWIRELLVKYPRLETELNRFLTEYNDQINNWISENVIGRAQEWAVGLSTGVISFIKALFNIILGMLISIYIINSKELFLGRGKKIIYAFLKKENANAFIHNLRFTNKTFLGFFGGKIVDSLIIGILCFILTTLIGTPYAALISLIVGVTNVIPYFGPFIGAIPSAFLILMVDPKQALYFIIMILILQQVDGNIIGPAILGQSTGLSAFWVIFAITFFGGLWGPVGMLVGVPLFAIIYAWIRTAVTARLENKNLPQDTRKYIQVDYIDENDRFVRLPKAEVDKIVSKKGFKDILKKKKSNEDNDDEDIDI